MSYFLLLCLSAAHSGSDCYTTVRLPYASRIECLAAFEYVKDQAPAQPVRMYCVTTFRVQNT